MIQNEHLQVFDLILTPRSPLYIGSGTVRKEMEYIFIPHDTVYMVNMNALFSCLIQRNLVEDYENFVFSNQKKLYDFLLHHGLSYDLASLSLYHVNASDALDSNHSLKEIHTFQRNTRYQAYVPGSSVKGALRTVFLSSMMKDKQGHWPENSKSKADSAQQMQRLEGEYLNTLALKKGKDSNKVLNDAVNSIFRGISVSDSLPISDEHMILSNKIDANREGVINRINLCRECVAPGTDIHFKLTLDQSVLNHKITVNTLQESIKNFIEFYRNTYLSHFREPDLIAGVSYDNCLILGGGSGFFSKTLAYQYLGKGGLNYVAQEMDRNFSRHGHKRDRESFHGTAHNIKNLSGISPHMIKYGKYNGLLYPYGLCEVKLT